MIMKTGKTYFLLIAAVLLIVSGMGNLLVIRKFYDGSENIRSAFACEKKIEMKEVCGPQEYEALIKLNKHWLEITIGMVNIVIGGFVLRNLRKNRPVIKV